ncbi:hypothetical protein [Bordetella petrii]|uniref:Uncharacterized protein n=1 Tax=Bordetella petrii (strain ATCC BAA-461 / DSM 12804 / CCUG 43448 / CIP 107267 / Se-1111R) TaxID=340100 RepID=A9I8W4_BORPD|nr:hypothetical protein [Bordetella petrii]CAP41297.1 hypothetical protein predicted by Glimmer/Critica [Bordetella petrii]
MTDKNLTDGQLRAGLDAADNEFLALRLAVKTLTVVLATHFPDSPIADTFESAATDLRERPEVPARVVEYLSEMAEVARRAVDSRE